MSLQSLARSRATQIQLLVFHNLLSAMSVAAVLEVGISDAAIHYFVSA